MSWKDSAEEGAKANLRTVPECPRWLGHPGFSKDFELKWKPEDTPIISAKVPQRILEEILSLNASTVTHTFSVQLSAPLICFIIHPLNISLMKMTVHGSCSTH